MVDDFPYPEQDTSTRHWESDEHHKETKKRQRERKTGKIMFKKKVNYDNIARQVRTASCCSKQCIQCILKISDIFRTREWFLKKSKEAQGQFLLNFFQVSRRSKGQNTVYVHTLERKYVCQKAWIFSHGIAYGRYVL